MTMKREEVVSSGQAHADLMDHVAKIAAIVNELPGSAHELYAEFLTFRKEAQDHFRDEEAPSGLFDNIVTAAPERLNAVDSMRQQHQRLRRGLEDLYCELAGMQSGGRFDTHGFKNRCEAFIDELREHERSETSLLQRTFYRDTAAGD